MGRTRQAHPGGTGGSGKNLSGRYRWLGSAAIALTLACGTITADFNRVIAIQIDEPSRLGIMVGDTVVLKATAINAAGNPVTDAVIVWALLDVDSGQVGFTLDPPTGRVIGISVGSGRVRAQVESLPSEPITISVTPADTTAPDIGSDVTRHPLKRN